MPHLFEMKKERKRSASRMEKAEVGKGDPLKRIDSMKYKEKEEVKKEKEKAVRDPILGCS